MFKRKPEAEIVVDGEKVEPCEMPDDPLRGLAAEVEQDARRQRKEAARATVRQRSLERASERLRDRMGEVVYERTLFRRYTVEVWRKQRIDGKLYRLEIYPGVPPTWAFNIEFFRGRWRA